jgi:hypothetical protein
MVGHFSLVVYFQRSGETQTMPEPENPAELLTSAIVFGGLYGSDYFCRRCC